MREQIINGTYRVMDIIGKGGMSTVYRGWHLRLNKAVAIKQVRKSTHFDFMAESDILKNLDHAMLPRIYDIFEDEESIFIVMDFVDGNSLDKVLQKQNIIPEKIVLGWFHDLAEVLQYLHEQKPFPIIYRDMKPSNVMLQKNGKLKVIDFGIAQQENAESRKAVNGGTRGYGAPEQFVHGGVTDARTDIYALGQTIFHLATGKSPLVKPYPPYQGDARSFNPDISVGLNEILKKCMMEAPAQRYQSAEELLYDLDHIYLFDHAYQVYLTRKKARRAYIIGLAAAGAAVFALGFFMNRQEQLDQYHDLLKQAYADNDAEAAMSMVQEAESMQPSESDAYEAELDTLNRLDSFQETLNRADELIEDGKVKEDSAKVLNAMASAEYELGSYEEAAELYQRVTESDTELSYVSSLNYGIALARLGRKEEALAVFTSMQETADEDEAAYLEGEVHALNGEYQEAVDSYSHALEITSDDTLKQKIVLEMSAALRDSYELAPEDSEYIADANSQIISLINKAMDSPSMSNNSVLWERLARAYSNLGQSEENSDDFLQAAKAYEKVISFGISKPNLYTGAFWACFNAGDYDTALKTVEEMKTAFPDLADPYIYKATTLMKIEGAKPQGERNYNEAYQEYLDGCEKTVSDEAKGQMQQLESAVEQLKSGGWLN